MRTRRINGNKDAAYVLVAGIGKDDDRETGQDGDDTLVGRETDVTLETHIIAFCKVVNDQDHEVANRNESNNTGVLERVKSSEERERNNNEPDCKLGGFTRRQQLDICSHESSNPEVSVQQVFSSRSVCETADNTWHEITNDDEITDADTETLDSDSSVEDDGSIGICDLTQSEETGVSTIQVSCASCL